MARGLLAYQVATFAITFLSYVSLHSTRKAFSNVKSNLAEQHWFAETSDATTDFLALLDTLFLAFYAAGLFMSGAIADRVSRRHVLAAGLLGTAVCTGAFGVLGLMRVHSRVPYAVAWAANGLVQSTGWPTSVAVMSNWFAARRGHKGTRGGILGIWSSNANVGNMAGSGLTIATMAVCHAISPHVEHDIGWQASILVSAAFALVMGLVTFFLLVETPADVGLALPEDDAPGLPVQDESEPLMAPVASQGSRLGDERGGVSFLRALLIPGVVNYALAYACCKMVNYSLFFWLPYYLDQGLDIRSSKANELSNLYDAGQVVGGWLAGAISDRMYQRRSPTMVVCLFLSIGSLFFLRAVHRHDVVSLAVTLAATGFFFGGPANIISSAVAADLGQHPAVSGDAKAESTVTGIVDGTGAVGAALGQVLVAAVSDHWGWHAVFTMLMIATALAVVCILQMLVNDVRWLRAHRRRDR